jgi:NAD(P)-dependent dehydrogenase (short-subunit alcohol dehydrogenase family)
VRLESQVAIVTGAARGIGRATALRLAREGADIVIVGRDLSPSYERFGEEISAGTVQDEIRGLGRRVLACQGDLRDRAMAQEVIRRALDEFGRIDVLVNNAGGALTPVDRSLASEMPAEDLTEMLKLNLYSTIYCCQEVVPTMREAGHGSIINVASRVAIDPAIQDGRLTPYGLAKSSVIQYSRFLAKELGPAGVRVNCVSPGLVATARIVKTAEERGIGTERELRHIPLRRFATPEDIAGVMEFLACDELSGYVTGQCLSVDGGAVLTTS